MLVMPTPNMRTELNVSQLTDLAIQWTGGTVMFDMERCDHCGTMARLRDIQLVNGDCVCTWCQGFIQPA